mmetsp:Transcript_88019/g.251153  ORF Transcript_88019/g.251153 Transcript_88019/m.251153 type:complete len:239 (-) Transcript_88019:83-799(-)
MIEGTARRSCSRSRRSWRESGRRRQQQRVTRARTRLQPLREGGGRLLQLPLLRRRWGGGLRRWRRRLSRRRWKWQWPKGRLRIVTSFRPMKRPRRWWLSLMSGRRCWAASTPTTSGTSKRCPARGPARLFITFLFCFGACLLLTSLAHDPRRAGILARSQCATTTAPTTSLTTTATPKQTNTRVESRRQVDGPAVRCMGAGGWTDTGRGGGSCVRRECVCAARPSYRQICMRVHGQSL